MANPQIILQGSVKEASKWIGLARKWANQLEASGIRRKYWDLGSAIIRIENYGQGLMKALITDDQGVIDEMFPSKDQPDGDIYTTGLRVVVPNADSPVKAEQFDADVVEFMLLPDFQAWLKKYNLTSS